MDTWVAFVTQSNLLLRRWDRPTVLGGSLARERCYASTCQNIRILANHTRHTSKSIRMFPLCDSASVDYRMLLQSKGSPELAKRSQWQANKPGFQLDDVTC